MTAPLSEDLRDRVVQAVEAVSRGGRRRQNSRFRLPLPVRWHQRFKRQGDVQPAGLAVIASAIALKPMPAQS